MFTEQLFIISSTECFKRKRENVKMYLKTNLYYKKQRNMQVMQWLKFRYHIKLELISC